MVEADLIKPGYTISKYTLQEELGVGAFGKVFKALDTENKEYAIKIISSGIRENEGWRHFLSEIECLQCLCSDNIIHIYGEPLEQDAYIFLILEYCNGPNLLDYLLGRDFQLSMQEVMEMANDLAYALFVMHSEEIAHRDLKLENIMVHNDPVSKKRMFKLIDLGLSRKINSVAETIAGSRGYIAPQIMNGVPYTKSADIWSYGILLFQMAFKTFPFGKNTYHINVMKGKCKITKEGIASRNYMDLLQKCLKYEEGDRLTIGEILDHPFMMIPDNGKSPITEFNIK